MGGDKGTNHRVGRGEERPIGEGGMEQPTTEEGRRDGTTTHRAGKEKRTTRANHRRDGRNRKGGEEEPTTGEMYARCVFANSCLRRQGQAYKF